MMTVFCPLGALTGTLHDDGVLSLGRLDGQLVERHDLSASLEHASAGTLSHVQAADLELGQVENAHIIRDGSHNDSDLVLAARLLHITHHTCDGDGRAVILAHEEPLKDYLVNLRISSTCQEAIKLHKQTQVDIIAFRLGSVDLSVLIVTNVDTHLVVDG